MQVYTGNQIRLETRPEPAKGNNDFRDIFQSIQRPDVQFSRHANTRLNSRAINLSNEQLKRVEGAIAKAGEKGIRDSLVLVDNVALVVNVKNKLVITAMSQSDENVFTNIDGAVIV